MQKPKAAYIGKENIGQVFKENKTDWEFVTITPNIETFSDQLIKEEISDDINVIIILDTLFDPTQNNTEFEHFIAQYAPYCLIGILNYKKKEELINERVRNLPEYDSSPYYYIDKNTPVPSLEEAIYRFSQDSPQTENIAILNNKEIDETTREEIKKQEQIIKEKENFLQNIPPNGKIISFTSSKGGSGKSTLATLFSTSLAHQNPKLKICLLDLDIETGQISYLTGNNKPTVVQLLKSGISKEEIEKAVITSPTLKIDLLLAPNMSKTAQELTPEFYKEILQYLQRMYDYIILDTSVRFLSPLLTEVAYPLSSKIVFVTDMVITSTNSMHKWINEIIQQPEKNGLGINKNKIGIVINKALDDIEMPATKIKEVSEGVQLLSIIPNAPKLIYHAANTQSMEILVNQPSLKPYIDRLIQVITHTI